MTITAALLALATFLAGLYLGHRWGSHDARVEANEQKRRFQRILRFAEPYIDAHADAQHWQVDRNARRRDHRPAPATDPLRHTGAGNEGVTRRQATTEGVALTQWQPRTTHGGWTASQSRVLRASSLLATKRKAAASSLIRQPAGNALYCFEFVTYATLRY